MAIFNEIFKKIDYLKLKFYALNFSLFIKSRKKRTYVLFLPLSLKLDRWQM